MAFPCSHKTIFILDHSPFFAQSCQQSVDFDTSSKSSKSTPNNSTFTLTKSLWTCNVEAAIDYLRIVSDLFPDVQNEKLIQFILSDSAGRYLGTPGWGPENRNMDKMLDNLAKFGPPDSTGDADSCCILNGLSLAIEALTVVTETQRRYASTSTFRNRGRIVCLTHFKQFEEVGMAQDHVIETISGRNKLVENLKDDQFICLDEVELCFVNVFPADDPVAKTFGNRTLTKIAPNLTVELYTSTSGRDVSDRLHALVQEHYELASSTVTNIPMKEEQNAGVSANYDVEIFHHKDVLKEFRIAGYLHPDTGIAKLQAAGYRTVCLRWCSPASKGSQTDMQISSETFRISTVDVNGRPSICLTNFLLSGRTVMLEVLAPSRALASCAATNKDSKPLTPQKHITHMLTAHGGHIYMHSLQYTVGGSKFHLEDPPMTITDGLGGLVKDYRTQAFVDLMRECLLAPGEPRKDTASACKQHLSNVTQFWPMTSAESVLFSMGGKADTFVNLLKKRELTDKELEQCRKLVYQFRSDESMSVSNFNALVAKCPKAKGLKRDEVFKLMWTELEDYAMQYLACSPHHKSVVSLIYEVTGRNSEALEALLKRKAPQPKPSSVVNLVAEDEHFVVCDTPESPPMSPVHANPSTKRPKLEFDHEGKPMSGGKALNLLDMWLEKYQTQRWSKWKDFDGRAGNDTKIAELYTELNEKFRQSTKEMMEVGSVDR